ASPHRNNQRAGDNSSTLAAKNRSTALQRQYRRADAIHGPTASQTLRPQQLMFRGNPPQTTIHSAPATHDRDTQLTPRKPTTTHLSSVAQNQASQAQPGDGICRSTSERIH